MCILDMKPNYFIRISIYPSPERDYKVYCIYFG